MLVASRSGAVFAVSLGPPEDAHMEARLGGHRRVGNGPGEGPAPAPVVPVRVLAAFPAACPTVAADLSIRMARLAGGGRLKRGQRWSRDDPDSRKAMTRALFRSWAGGERRPRRDRVAARMRVCAYGQSTMVDQPFPG